MLHVHAPAAPTVDSWASHRAATLQNFLRAWSPRPGDEHTKLTNGQGRLLTYPENVETQRGELLYQRPSFQARLNAKRALLTPNVCTARPLPGMQLVPVKIQRH